MPTTAASSELFRFAVQRAVQTADPVVVQRQAVLAYLDTSEVSELHAQLAAFRPQPQARVQMVGAAATFITSASFIRDRDEANGLRTAIRRFAVWLRHAVTPTYEEARAKIDALFGLSGSALFDFVRGADFRQDLRNIIDSLIAVSVCCTRRDVRTHDYLVLLLRACRLMQRMAASDPHGQSQAAIQAALREPALLPPDVFPLPASPDESPAPAPAPAGDGVELLRTRSAALQRAHDELRAVTADDLAVPASLRSQALPGNPVPPAWALSADAVASKLSAGTRGLFEEARLALDKTSFPQVVKWLESELSQAGLNLYHTQRTLGPIQLIRRGQSTLAFRPNVSARTRGGRPPGANELPIPEGATPRPYIGVADLLIVEQDWNRYEEGEIAHIENVLRGEYKQRVHRRLDRTEETITASTERTTESERDTQSTERFELKLEASETIKAETKIDTGVEVSGDYGPVKIATKLGASFGISYEQSTKTSSTYAREVTERAKNRVEEKVREERVRKILQEVEETNTHGIDNKGQPDHVIGMYRWLDKVYCARLMNYGRRALFEFVVPEPAAYYLYAMTNQPPAGVVLEEPLPALATPSGLPVPPGEEDQGRALSPHDLDVFTYLAWISRYQVEDVTPPPEGYVTTSVALAPAGTGSAGRVITAEVKLPDSYDPNFYVAFGATLTFADLGPVDAENGPSSSNPWKYSLYVGIGQSAFQMNPQLQSWTTRLCGESGIVPVTVKIPDGSRLADEGYALTIEVMWQRIWPPADWQIATYGAIMRAYQRLKSAYDQQVAAASAQEAISISGRNPLLNRSIEQTELKKAVLSKLTQQYFTQFDATRSSEGGIPYAENGVPYFDFAESDVEGEYIQFFEQAFEWSNMTYSFYPYFWGRNAGWRERLTQITDVDPLFESCKPSASGVLDGWLRS